MNFSNVETLSFEEILEQEDYVICDSSLTSGEGGDWYWDGVYPANSFSGIDIKIEEKQAECLGRFLSLLRNPNIYAVPGTVKEIERARKMVSDTVKFLEKREKIAAKIHRKKFPENGFREGNKRRELLEEIHGLFYESYLESRKRRFNPQDRAKYGFLEDIVLRVTEETNAKVDSNERYREKRIKLKNVTDFHTDEQMVAASLYLSSVEGKSSGILTRDSDIRRIMEYTLNYGNLKGIFDLIAKNRIRIYFMTETNGARRCFDSSEYKK